MKIKASAEQDVSILTLSKTVDINDVQIIKAGVNKLLRNGKNKIIIEMPEKVSLTSEVIREFVQMDLLARELRGRIVLSGLDTPTKAKIISFCAPPAVACYTSRQEALQLFRAAQVAKPGPELVGQSKPQPPVSTGTGATPSQPTPAQSAVINAPSASVQSTSQPATTVTPPSSAPLAPPASVPSSVAASTPVGPTAIDPTERERFRAKEIQELGPLRSKIIEQEKEILLLREQLIVLMGLRKVPPTQQAYEDKILHLEKELERAILAAQTVAAAKK